MLSIAYSFYWLIQKIIFAVQTMNNYKTKDT